MPEQYIHSPELTELGKIRNYDEIPAALAELKTPFAVLTYSAGCSGEIVNREQLEKLGLRLLGTGVNRFYAYGPDSAHQMAMWWYATSKVEPLSEVPKQAWPPLHLDFGREPHSFAYCCGAKFFDGKFPDTIKDYGQGRAQKTSNWISLLRVAAPTKAKLRDLLKDDWQIVEEHKSNVIYLQRNLKLPK